MPQILTHGLVSAGGVFLRIERRQILGYMAQVFPASIDSLDDKLEAVTPCTLVGRHRRRTFGFLAQEQSVAVAACGCCYAVCTQQHLAARVLTALTRFA